jgi:hypothetical protein
VHVADPRRDDIRPRNLRSGTERKAESKVVIYRSSVGVYRVPGSPDVRRELQPPPSVGVLLYQGIPLPVHCDHELAT